MAYRSSAFAGSDTGGDITATPAGVQTDDYLAGLAIFDLTANPPTGTTGWTERANIDQATPDSQTGRLYDTIATGSDDYTWSYGVNNAGSLIAAWSGRNTAAPRTFVQTTIDTTLNTSPISASFTGGTAVEGDDIAVFVSLDKDGSSDNWTFSTITGYTQRLTDNTIQFITAHLQTQDNVSAGATGSLTSTITRNTGIAGSGYASVVVGIAAGSAGGNPPARWFVS